MKAISNLARPYEHLNKHYLISTLKCNNLPPFSANFSTTKFFFEQWRFTEIKINFKMVGSLKSMKEQRSGTTKYFSHNQSLKNAKNTFPKAFFP